MTPKFLSALVVALLAVVCSGCEGEAIPADAVSENAAPGEDAAQAGGTKEIASTVKRWDFSPARITFVGFDSDKSELHIGMLDANFIAIDAASLEERRRLTLPGRVCNVLPGSDGNALIVAQGDRQGAGVQDSAYFCRADTGEVAVRVKDVIHYHDGSIAKARSDAMLCLTPDGRHLLIEHKPLTFIRRELADLKKSNRFSAKTETDLGRETIGMRASADGRRLAVVDKNGFLRLFDLESGAELNKPVRIRPYLGTVDFSADLTRVVAGAVAPFARTFQGEVVVWDISNNRELAAFPLPDEGPTVVSFFGEGAVVAASTTGQVHAWRTADAAAIGSIRIHQRPINYLSVDKAGVRIITADDRGEVILTDWKGI